MKILEYNEVDPLKVMYVNKLALDFALSPERASSIRQTDPRPFPCLAIYAVDEEAVLGQIGIFRLPMISTEGREDVGGIWAVSTHPEYSRQGVANLLLDEAHTRMREAGLRFSTLGTDRYRLAYNLYQKHGYQETNVWATALARWEIAHQPTRVRAQPLGSSGYDFVEQIFHDIAQEYLGFAWRHTPFASLRHAVDPADIWILLENNRVVGYALARLEKTLLSISNIVLRRNVDVIEAIAALTAELKSAYIQVKVSRPIEIASLRNAGFHVAHPNWDSFLVKPLVPEVSFQDAQKLFGVGTDQFLISWLDVT
ncbi:MAG: GNAT family N-acetyltransferase [Chloroflexota bacterium]|nr:MAG: GNAT family N-acetyltransferase [Chloroflexota bacterium]